MLQCRGGSSCSVLMEWWNTSLWRSWRLVFHPTLILLGSFLLAIHSQSGAVSSEVVEDGGKGRREGIQGFRTAEQINSPRNLFLLSPRLHTCLTSKKGHKLWETQTQVFHVTGKPCGWISGVAQRFWSSCRLQETFLCTWYLRVGTKNWGRDIALSDVAAAGIKRHQDPCWSGPAL